MKDVGYRNNEHILTQIKFNDPILNYFEKLKIQDLISQVDFENLIYEEKKLVDLAIEFAEKSPLPSVDDLYNNIFV